MTNQRLYSLILREEKKIKKSYNTKYMGALQKTHCLRYIRYDQIMKISRKLGNNIETAEVLFILNECLNKAHCCRVDSVCNTLQVENMQVEDAFDLSNATSTFRPFCQTSLI